MDFKLVINQKSAFSSIRSNFSCFHYVSSMMSWRDFKKKSCLLFHCPVMRDTWPHGIFASIFHHFFQVLHVITIFDRRTSLIHEYTQQFFYYLPIHDMYTFMTFFYDLLICGLYRFMIFSRAVSMIVNNTKGACKLTKYD